MGSGWFLSNHCKIYSLSSLNVLLKHFGIFDYLAFVHVLIRCFWVPSLLDYSKSFTLGFRYDFLRQLIETSKTGRPVMLLPST